jgi:DNA helicase II / ATP-dependent DNA helicase PcrA
LQWRMMQRLSEKHGNITVVGDPNQAIYGFRGAKPENITNFEQWFPGGRKYYLGINYRSTQNIVNFIRENAPKDTPQELLDKMVAFRKEEGKKIAMKMYWTDDAEAESALKLASADPLNSAILARTNRMVGLLERLCNRYGVRYHLLGKTGYWKQNEIRKAIEALKDYPNLSAVAACNLALPHLEAKYAVADRTERDNDALENLAVLRTIAKEHNTAKDFVVYGNKMMHRRNDARGITISTIHQAKGSEWDNVYLIGANAKMIPHKNGDPLEEARIYLVGISRPRNFLRISFAGTPSPYLRKYLTEEILDKLTACADEVQSLQSQHKLFEEQS